MPFGSNLIRCIAGLVCYSAWLWLRNHALNGSDGRSFLGVIGDRRAMLAMIITVFSGPFIGVGLSLTAVQYTAAGIASTLMAMTPVLILFPSRWLFHQPITLRAVLGAMISCVGVSLFFLI